MDRVGLVNQVPINVMLDNELGRIEPGSLSVNGLILPVHGLSGFKVLMLDEPVIENLTAHNMPPDPPAVLVALVPQPMVSQQLCIKVMRLER